MVCIECNELTDSDDLICPDCLTKVRDTIMKLSKIQSEILEFLKQNPDADVS